MSRFTDSSATIIGAPFSEEVETTQNKDQSLVHIEPNSETQVSFMGAVTQPIQDGTSISIDATPENLKINELTYTHPELGWCVNFVPPDGVLSQMAQLQEFRENNPTEAAELCMKCENMIQIATVGELNEFRQVCGKILAIPSWGKPPPMW
jgi:hypothetical protein